MAEAITTAPCGHEVTINPECSVWAYVDCEECVIAFEYRVTNEELEWAEAVL